MSSNKKTFTTISSLIKKDLKEAYYLPAVPSSYTDQAYRFVNDKIYRVFDDPFSLQYFFFLYPLRDLAAAGDEIPILLDSRPPSYLTEHWKTWLSPFPLATIQTIDQALLDDVPIVTTAAFQSIPEKKHSVHPDILYKLHQKSSIPEIGVSCPKHMEEAAVEFPCMIKVDSSCSGEGNHLAKNESDFSVILRRIRELHGWKDKIVFQEVIQEIKEVIGYQFYLHKSGEISWLGTMVNKLKGYEWAGGQVDWGTQESSKNLVWEEFTIPIAKYLHKHGYFGFVDYELLVNDQGMYLSDVNPRLAGGTTHFLLAPFMAEMGLVHSLCLSRKIFDVPPTKIIKNADHINDTNVGKVIVLGATRVDNGCQCELSIFAKTHEEMHSISHKLLSM